MHVYMDAVFYPNIYKYRQIFMQEGWHYELEKPEDELTINGVVYSEMKGAMSSPDRTVWDELNQVLLPDTTYGVNSGGDPEVIPELTREYYLDFHRSHYHAAGPRTSRTRLTPSDPEAPGGPCPRPSQPPF